MIAKERWCSPVVMGSMAEKETQLWSEVERITAGPYGFICCQGHEEPNPPHFLRSYEREKLVF